MEAYFNRETKIEKEQEINPEEEMVIIGPNYLFNIHSFFNNNEESPNEVSRIENSSADTDSNNSQEVNVRGTKPLKDK